MDNNLMDRQVIAIFGPTGVGKTAVAIELAKLLKATGRSCVAVSADALQLYQGIEVLTGVASPADQAQLEHRMVSFLPVSRQFNVSEYAKLAHKEIDSIIDEGKTPIVVGGTGMYLRAALTELSLQPPPLPGLRERIKRELDSKGIEKLYDELTAAAPWIESRVKSTDTQRVLRNLELLRQGELKEPSANSQLWATSTRRPTLLFGLTAERQYLKDQIDSRVDLMVKEGAEQEAKAAVQNSACETVLKAVGLRELLAGDTDQMKIKTHQYSRRQCTWMRKLPQTDLLDTTNATPQNTAKRVFEKLPAALRATD